MFLMIRVYANNIFYKLIGNDRISTEREQQQKISINTIARVITIIQFADNKLRHLSSIAVA